MTLITITFLYYCKLYYLRELVEEVDSMLETLSIVDKFIKSGRKALLFIILYILLDVITNFIYYPETNYTITVPNWAAIIIVILISVVIFYFWENEKVS